MALLVCWHRTEFWLNENPRHREVTGIFTCTYGTTGVQVAVKVKSPNGLTGVKVVAFAANVWPATPHPAKLYEARVGAAGKVMVVPVTYVAEPESPVPLANDHVRLLVFAVHFA